jgi:SP family myo-inositol transporter-like MFS transporter 13
MAMSFSLFFLKKKYQTAGPIICRMLSYPPTRRALVVGCGLQMFQQLSGINTIMYVFLLAFS